jgi:hypothetical protein
VLPLFAGGPLQERSNTALLCPNHAALADLSAFQSVDAFGTYRGPKTREELFETIHRMDRRRGEPFILTQATTAMEGFRADDQAGKQG